MPSSESLEAQVEPCTLDRRAVVVDPRFAGRLTTRHSRTFELEASVLPDGAEVFTRDLPSISEAELAMLDEHGLVRVGTAIRRGSLLIGKVTPRPAEARTPEEKPPPASVGENRGLVDASLRAPPGCAGFVDAATLEDGGRRARVVVSWTCPLHIGDGLELDGELVTVSGIAPLESNVAWSGGRSLVRVRRVELAVEVLHARSVGPYVPLTRQPTSGREQLGGQRLSWAHVALLGSHAPWALWECFTMKADDAMGRVRAFESLVKGDNPAPSERPAQPPRMGDIFSFFGPPVYRAGSLGELPEVMKLVVVHLRAMGVELDLGTQDVTATLLFGERLRAQSHGDVTLQTRFEPRVFGPVADYRCECGKYTRMKHRGVVCEDCGVVVDRAQVRRERSATFELQWPQLHPLYRREVAALLGLSDDELDQQVDDGRALRAQLEALDLAAIARQDGPASIVARALTSSRVGADAFVIDTLVVLPAALRPEGSRLDTHYVEVFGARSSAELRRALVGLFAELSEVAAGLWERHAFEKCVDYSALARVVVDPTLARGWCRVPRVALVELFRGQAYRSLEERGYVTSLKEARSMLDDAWPEALLAVDEVSHGHPVLLAGERMLARLVEPWDAPAIAVDARTADLLGTATVALHVPLSHEAAVESLALADDAEVRSEPPTGWLARAMVERSLIPAVLEAALRGEPEPVTHPVLSAALGRYPAAREAVELETWARRRSVERQAYFEAHEAEVVEEVLSRGVTELALSETTLFAVMSTGILTLGDLVRRHEPELLEVGLDREDVEEVRGALAELGLSLGMGQ